MERGLISWNGLSNRNITLCLAASDVPATLSAISNLAKRGVLFKGGSLSIKLR